jgi:hypothetical protein
MGVIQLLIDHIQGKMVLRLLLVGLMALLLQAACVQASPTPTPTPKPAVQGVHTPDGMRAQYERWPDDYKVAIDEEVVVLFAYPSPIIDWAGFAFINHIPLASSVTLGRPFSIMWPDGTVIPAHPDREEMIWGERLTVWRHYTSEEAKARLDAVLTDEGLMRRILGDALVAPPTPTPKLRSTSCSPPIKELPCGPGAEIRKTYAYHLYTHCGIRWAYFNGRWWEASPPLDDGSGNPPRGWGNAFDMGTMELVNESLIRFTSHAGKTAEFKLLPVEVQEYPGEACD